MFGYLVSVGPQHSVMYREATFSQSKVAQIPACHLNAKLKLEVKDIGSPGLK
jgi:hypothetical protein